MGVVTLVSETEICLRRERVNELRRAWRRANPDKVRAEKARWRNRHPDVKRAQKLRAKAREAGAAGADYTTAGMIAARRAFYGGRCYYCGVACADTLDHRIPLARGGSHWPANLVPACNSCNGRKWIMTEPEFWAMLAVASA